MYHLLPPDLAASTVDAKIADLRDSVRSSTRTRSIISHHTKVIESRRDLGQNYHDIITVEEEVIGFGLRKVATSDDLPKKVEEEDEDKVLAEILAERPGRSWVRYRNYKY